MDNEMAGHGMGGMTDSTPVLQHAGIPPASDPQEFARAVAANPAPTATAPAAPGATIRILPGAGNTNAMDTYEPKVLTVKRGTTVNWLNTDPDVVHNVVDDKDAYLSALIPTGQSWSHRFDRPGVFPFHCKPHPWMQGKVIVR